MRKDASQEAVERHGQVVQRHGWRRWSLRPQTVRRPPAATALPEMRRFGLGFRPRTGRPIRTICTRVRTQLGPPDQGGGEKNASQVVSGELVVAGGDEPESLSLANMRSMRFSPAIGFPVMWNEGFPPSAGRNDSFNAVLLKDSSQAVGVVGLVGDQSFDRSSCT